MNTNIQLNGLNEKIIDGAIHFGLVKTKTEAIRAGLMELNHKYDILEQLEDEEDVRESKKILSEIKSGKQKTYSLEEFKKLTGAKISEKNTK